MEKWIVGLIIVCVVAIGSAAFLILRTPAPAQQDATVTAARSPSTGPSTAARQASPLTPFTARVASAAQPSAVETPEQRELRRLREENERLRAQAARAAQSAQSPAAAAPASLEKPPKLTTISGSAWLTREGGDSDVLRGLRIRLLSSATPKEAVARSLQHNVKQWRDWEKFENDQAKQYANEEFMKDTVTAAHKEAADSESRAKAVEATISQLPATMDVRRAYSMAVDSSQYKVPSFDAVVDATAMYETKTDVNGKYTLRDLPVGSYYLQAEIDSSKHFVEWLIPILADGTDMSIDIENGTAITIHN